MLMHGLAVAQAILVSVVSLVAGSSSSGSLGPRSLAIRQRCCEGSFQDPSCLLRWAHWAQLSSRRLGQGSFRSRHGSASQRPPGSDSLHRVPDLDSPSGSWYAVRMFWCAHPRGCLEVDDSPHGPPCSRSCRRGGPRRDVWRKCGVPRSRSCLGNCGGSRPGYVHGEPLQARAGFDPKARSRLCDGPRAP